MPVKRLRRLLSLALFLVLVVSCAPVWADDDIVPAQPEETVLQVTPEGESASGSVEAPEDGNEEDAEEVVNTEEEKEEEKGKSTEYGAENDTAETPEVSDDAAVKDEPAARVLAEEQDEQETVPNENASCSIEEYIRRMMYGTPKNMRGTVAYYALRENEQRLYNSLKPLVAQLAAGERNSSILRLPVSEVYDENHLTAEDLGVERLMYYDDEGIPHIDREASAAYRKRFPLVFDNVFHALLFDCPYEFYWQDKIVVSQYTGSTITTDGETMWTKLANSDGSPTMITVKLPISGDYSKTGERGTYDLDTGCGKTVQTAVANARQIVTDNAGKKDLQKLSAYAKKICELTDYNKAAAGSGSSSYGNPWQLIWVFDGDPETKVVCEGFAKAFQYLCDQSSFSGSVEAIAVSGRFSGSSGSHMWNLVTLDDGYRYLVDLTYIRVYEANLFMRGYSKKISDLEYVYYDGTRKYDYIFDEETYNLFHEGHLDPDPDWSIDGEVLTVAVAGDTPDYSSADVLPWADRLEDIREVIIGNYVTRLGDNVLSGLNLVSLTLPASLESISPDALATTTVELVRIEEYSDYLIGWAEEHHLDYIILHHTVTLTFDDEPVEIEYGTDYDVKDPGKDGYKFLKWVRLVKDAAGKEVEVDVDPETEWKNVKEDRKYVSKWRLAAIESAFSASFTANLRLNFFYNMPEDLVKDSTAYVTITSAAAGIKDKKAVTGDGKSGEDYYFVEEIPIKFFYAPLYVKVFKGNDQVAVYNKAGDRLDEDTFVASLADYADIAIEKGKSSMKKLAKALKYYGYAAAKYFGGTVPEEQPEVPGALTWKDEIKHEGTVPAGITNVSVSVNFRSANRLNVIYTPVAGQSLENYTITLDGKDVTSSVQVVKGEWYVSIKEIPGKKLGDDHVFTISDGTDTYTTTASVTRYAKSIHGKTNDEFMKKLAEAVYLYYEAAKAYFDN